MNGAEHSFDENASRLPRRDPAGHKGTFGTVAVIGGCSAGDTRMVGAPALSALGALRAGAGLVKIVAPEPVLAAALSISPSATGVALPVDTCGRVILSDAAAVIDRMTQTCRALVIGPGMGPGPEVGAAALRAVQQEDVPVIVDADALNALAGVTDLYRDFKAAAVLTPHPGEYRRFAASLRIVHDPVDPSSRPTAAAALAQRLGCVCVLKGSRSVVSDGLRTWVCGAGHACLATAGTGDVLAGLIAGLVAQFGPSAPVVRGATPGASLDLFTLACIGVLAHARAGESWASGHGSEAGLVATELADLLPPQLERLRGAG